MFTMVQNTRKELTSSIQVVQVFCINLQRMRHPTLNYVARQSLHQALVSYHIHLLTADIAQSIALNLKQKCTYIAPLWKISSISSIARQCDTVSGVQWRLSEAYSEPCQTCKMECSTKIVNGFQPFTIFAKCSILGVWQHSE